MRMFSREEVARLAKSGLRVKKSITGDMSAVTEYDPGDIDREQPEATNDSIRLGDARVMPNKTKILPYTMREFDTSTGTPMPDPFLRGTPVDGYIGGAERRYTPGLEFIRENAGAYRFVQPDADARGPENFLDRGDAGISGPAGARFPGAGLVGGREPSSYTVKMATLKAMYEEEDDDEKRKALKAAMRALKAAQADEDADDDEDDDAKRKSVKRGLFKSLFGRQDRNNSNPGVAAADAFLCGGE